jgi:hypothetical protein
MADIITMTCVRPALNQTIVVTIPEPIVLLLDWMASNVKNPDGTSQYMYGLNVIWRDVIDQLVPKWRQQYIEGQLADARLQMVTHVTQVVGEALAALTVVAPDPTTLAPTAPVPPL